MSYPIQASDFTPKKCPVSIGDEIRLKGTDKRMWVNCVYRQGNETRIKAQWAEQDGDGFVDLSLGLVDSSQQENKAVGPLVYRCKCPTLDLANITMDGLGVHCSKCGQTKTLACMMIEKNFPEKFPELYGEQEESTKEPE